MCSIGEDDFGDEGGVHSMQQNSDALGINDLSGICKKCDNEPAAVKLSFKEAECKTCFLIYVRHKFRASLGSSKILPKDAKVLLIFDGSPNSVTLLDMAYFAQTQNTFKRLHCNLKALVINDSFLGHQEPNYLDKILEILKNYQISSYYISLASSKSPVPIIGQTAAQLSSLSVLEEEKLVSLLGNIKSMTSRQDYLTNLQKNVTRQAAEDLQSPFVFLADTSPHLATTFLTNVSLGRGYATAHDIGLVDDRVGNLKLIRPLKDLIEPEVGYYIKFNSLSTVQCNTYGSDTDAMASIQNLTKSFVENLQEKFPATVSTVFRTGNKITTSSQLRSDSSGQKDEVMCRLCRSAISTDESKTLLAIEFSRIVCGFAADGLNDISGLEDQARQQLNKNSEGQLCHACRNILRDASQSGVELMQFL